MDLLERIQMKPAVRFQKLALWSCIGIGLFVPLSTSLTGIVLGLGVASWVLSGGYKEKWFLVRGNPVAVLSLIAACLYAGGVLYGQMGVDFLSDIKVFLLIPFFITVFREERHRQLALQGFLIAMVATMVLSFLFFFLNERMGVEFWRKRENTVFLNWITQNLFMALACIMLAHQARLRSIPGQKIFFGILSFLVAINVWFIVPGRSGQVVLVLLGVYFFISWFSWKKVTVALIGIILFSSAIYPYLGNYFPARFAITLEKYKKWKPDEPLKKEDVEADRLEFYLNTIRIIKKNPIWGVGTGGFEKAYQKEAKVRGMVTTDNPHNEYLFTAAELGLVGLGFLLFFFGVQWKAAGSLANSSHVFLCRAMLLMVLGGCLFNSLLRDYSESILYAWMTGLFYSGLEPHKFFRQGTHKDANRCGGHYL